MEAISSNQHISKQLLYYRIVCIGLESCLGIRNVPHSSLLRFHPRTKFLSKQKLACTSTGMGLVEYPDSDIESEVEEDLDVEAPPRKRARKNSAVSKSNDHPKSTLPSLPIAFHDLYASTIRVSVQDDPNLHGGRKRVIPHIEGNWPTHIYLEWYPQRAELAILSHILSKCETRLNDDSSKICSLLHSDLGVQLPLHISLSKPVILTTDQKQPFVEVFEQAIEASNTQPFTVVPDTLDWVSNSERTRWFLVIRLKKPKGDNLNQLLRVSNQTLAMFGQPPLYIPEEDSHSRHPTNKRGKTTSHRNEEDVIDLTANFHISLAWSLAEPRPEEQERVSGIDLDALKSLEISFNSVKAKIGNFVLNFRLQ